MDPKNFVVILLAFCTTLLLGFGISIVFGATGIDLCKDAYCYIIRDFIQYYRTVFVTFGISLTVIAICGISGLVLRNKKILTFYARLLVLTLFGLIMVLSAGIWAKGPIQLRTNMLVALKTYGFNCRTIASVDSLQTELKCCGIDRPEDWGYVFNRSSIQPPLSCCNTNVLYDEEVNGNQCLSPYSRGCLGPLRQLFWRFFNVVALMAAVIALKSTVAIICTYKILNSCDSTTGYILSQQNLIATPATAPMNMAYNSEENYIKRVSSSTVI